MNLIESVLMVRKPASSNNVNDIEIMKLLSNEEYLFESKKCQGDLRREYGELKTVQLSQMILEYTYVYKFYPIKDSVKWF